MARQIVVCDDEPHIVRAISLKLMRSGFDVTGTSDAETCWRLLHRNASPSLLILDDSLPAGLDALELVLRMRNDANLTDLPVIILATKSASIASQGLLTDLGIAEIVTKPFSPQELLETVHRVLDDERRGQVCDFFEMGRPHQSPHRASD